LATSYEAAWESKMAVGYCRESADSRLEFSGLSVSDRKLGKVALPTSLYHRDLNGPFPGEYVDADVVLVADQQQIDRRSRLFQVVNPQSAASTAYQRTMRSVAAVKS
jgi:hypothetical protein